MTPRSLATAALAFVLAAFPAGCARPAFYPIGIYGTAGTNSFTVLSRAGFNVVRGPADARFLDAAHAHGLKVLASPRTSAGHFNAARAAAAVREFDSHPALWAWYVIDEPDLNRVSPEEVKRANDFIKRLPGTKPTALVLFQGQNAQHYAGLTDILMIDRYPIPWLPLASFPQHVRQARLAAGPDTPLIAVIQAFDWSYYPKLLPNESNLRAPTYEELRCMTYCALVQRADGLFYYCYDDGHFSMDKHPEVWGALQMVLAEVQDRLPLFQARHRWFSFIVEYEEYEKRFNEALEASIQFALLDVPKSAGSRAGQYVLAVNTTPHSLKYRFSSPWPAQREVPVFEEDRALEPDGIWLADEIDSYGVRIYGPISPGAAE